MEAGSKINNLNLSYPTFGLGRNSNSVNLTLLNQMGLYNPRLGSAITPGSKSLLLPEKITSSTKRLFGMGDEGVNVYSYSSEKPISDIITFTNPELLPITLVVIPENTKLFDGTVTITPKIAIYYPNNYGSMSKIVFSVGNSSSDSVGFDNNPITEYDKTSVHSITIASAGLLHSYAVSNLINQLNLIKTNPMRVTPIYSSSQLIQFVEGIFNSSGISLDLQGSMEGLINNLDKIAHNYITPLVVDLNGDGVLNHKDDLWNKLQIWQDLDSNRKAEIHELYYLRDLYINSISLSFKPLNLIDDYGNKHGDISNIKLNNGESINIVDVFFQTNNLYTQSLNLSNNLIQVISAFENNSSVVESNYLLEQNLTKMLS